MMKARIFSLEADVHFSDEVATVTEIIETENASIAISVRDRTPNQETRVFYRICDALTRLIVKNPVSGPMSISPIYYE